MPFANVHAPALGSPVTKKNIPFAKFGEGNAGRRGNKAGASLVRLAEP